MSDPYAAMDDATFFAVAKLNEPELVEAIRTGRHNCQCPGCSRMRRLLQESEAPNSITGGQAFTAEDIMRSEDDRPRMLDIPADASADPDAIREFFEAMGFEVVSVTDMRRADDLARDGDATSHDDLTHTEDFGLGGHAARRARALGGFETGDSLTVEKLQEAMRTLEAQSFEPYLRERIDPVQRPAPPIPNHGEAHYRKSTPIASGVMAYFPDALEEVARVSKVGNDQHNPGEPLHWAREKSTDEADALARHLNDFLRGDHFDTDGVPHAAKIAWRALALLQRWCDGEY